MYYLDFTPTVKECEQINNASFFQHPHLQYTIFAQSDRATETQQVPLRNVEDGIIHVHALQRDCPC